MHRTGHWLGLDVPDAGEYKVGEQMDDLQPGMTVTVEPGLYIRPADDIPPALAGIGIPSRTTCASPKRGCDVYTTAPKTIAEIERSCAVTDSRRNVDILIVGAGPVGMTLHLALAAGGPMVIAAARPPPLGPCKPTRAPSPCRTAPANCSNRSHSWPTRAATPIETIHVSQRTVSAAR